MSSFITIVALVVIAVIVRQLFMSQKGSNGENREEPGSNQPGEGYGFYSDDVEMDRRYTDLDDTEYFEDMMDDD